MKYFVTKIILKLIFATIMGIVNKIINKSFIGKMQFLLLKLKLQQKNV